MCIFWGDNMAQKSAVEEQLARLVTEQLRVVLQESVHSWLPELVAKVVQEEMSGKSSGMPTPSEFLPPEPAVGFDQLVRETFLPQIHHLARQMARTQVAQELPDVAERLVLAELQRL